MRNLTCHYQKKKEKKKERIHTLESTLVSRWCESLLWNVIFMNDTMHPFYAFYHLQSIWLTDISLKPCCRILLLTIVIEIYTRLKHVLDILFFFVLWNILFVIKKYFTRIQTYIGNEVFDDSIYSRNQNIWEYYILHYKNWRLDVASWTILSEIRRHDIAR